SPGCAGPASRSWTPHRASDRPWPGRCTSACTRPSRPVRGGPDDAGEEAVGRVATPARRQARRTEAQPGAVDFTIITGLSGAGRSEAAKSLEDLGYFVVDNLPPALLGKMAELAAATGGPARVAVVADARGGVFFGELSRGL